MKKVLSVLTLFIVNCSLFIASAQAVKLCRKCNWGDVLAMSPAKWQSNDKLLASSCTNTTGADSTWAFTSATSGAVGTISGNARCATSNSGTPVSSSSGSYCWCQVSGVTVGGNTCSAAGPWVFHFNNVTGAVACQTYCAEYCMLGCVENGSDRSCQRSLLFGGTASSEPSSVTCPLTGACTNTNYKTVGNSDSCGSGWVETTSPSLTISSTGTDSKGSYGYGACAK